VSLRPRNRSITLTSLASISLKEQLAPMELHRLLIDVRRRVEHEVTFEGAERRTKSIPL
jgi:hypothetical protein